jgi:RNA recognition motif-containing protein
LGAEERRIVVSNVSAKATKTQLQSFFNKFGKVFHKIKEFFKNYILRFNLVISLRTKIAVNQLFMQQCQKENSMGIMWSLSSKLDEYFA